MSDLRDFLNWFDGFAENIEKTPTAKQWAKIKERVGGLQLQKVEPEVRPLAPPSTLGATTISLAKRKPHPTAFKFIIDNQGVVRRGNGEPVLPSDVTDIIHDYRDGEADLRSIIWADGSTGLNGQDLTIVAA
jgi:hypothetical protein